MTRVALPLRSLFHGFLVAAGPVSRHVRRRPGGPRPRGRRPSRSSARRRPRRSRAAVDARPHDAPVGFHRVELRAAGAAVNGITPRVRSVISGGGFALGARYRNTLLFDRRAAVRVNAIGSTKRYYRLAAEFEARRIGGTPLFAASPEASASTPRRTSSASGRTPERTTAPTSCSARCAAARGPALVLVRLGDHRRRPRPPATGRRRRARLAPYPSIDQRFTTRRPRGSRASRRS